MRAEEERQHGLRDGDVAEEVHLELVPPRIQGQGLDRRVDGDTRVVDQDGQLRAHRVVRDSRDDSLDLLGFCDVEDHRFEVAGADAIGVRHAPDAGQDVVTTTRQFARSRETHARGSTGDQDQFTFM